MRPRASIILQAYRREVREGQRWLKEHRQHCVACSRSTGRNPRNGPCPTGLRIAKYVAFNESVVERMSSPPEGYEQPALFELGET